MGMEATNTKTMTSLVDWKNHRFLLGYVLSFLVCWATQGIFWGVAGHRGSLLAFVLLRLEEFLRVGAERLFGREVISYPPSFYAGSVVVSALLLASPLAGVFWIASAENRALRWSGYAALTLLFFVTFYWPSIPRALF